MTTDKTPATLATVRHGGCVQLATVPYDRARELIGDAYNAGTHGIGYSQQAMELHDAVITAQPSPGGQGDALLESLVARWRKDADEVGTSSNTLCQKIANCTMRHAAELQAVLAARQPVGEQHPDDLAVDAFAAAMKAKMAKARAKGRGGWEDPAQCRADDLSRMLREHVEKGDPRDVANFCMMLHQRGEAIAASNSVRQEPVGYLFTDDPAVYAMPGSGFHSGKEPPADAINVVPVYAAPTAQQTAQALDLPYSLDADPEGIRARAADAITGTLMVGAQGHTPPPAGHWAEPFWQAARADALVQEKTQAALQAAAKSLRTIANSTKDTEFLETASEIRAYANSRANCAEQAVVDSQAVGNG